MLPPCHGGGLATSRWSCSIPGPPHNSYTWGFIWDKEELERRLEGPCQRGGTVGDSGSTLVPLSSSCTNNLRAGGAAPFHLLRLTPAPFGLT